MCKYVLHWGGFFVITFLIIVYNVLFLHQFGLYFHTVRLLDTYFHITKGLTNYILFCITPEYSFAASFTNVCSGITRANVLRDCPLDILDCRPILFNGKILVIVNFETITEMNFRSLLDFVCRFRLSVTPEGTICIFGGMLLT